MHENDPEVSTSYQSPFSPATHVIAWGRFWIARSAATCPANLIRLRRPSTIHLGEPHILLLHQRPMSRYVGPCRHSQSPLSFIFPSSVSQADQDRSSPHDLAARTVAHLKAKGS